MDILKLQTDILKSMFKGERVLHFTTKDGRVAIGTGMFFGIIPKDKVMLRFATEEFESLRDRFDSSMSAYELAKQKCVILISPDGKKKVKCGKYITESGKVAFINIDYLKYYNKDAVLYVKDKVSPVLVFEDDIFAGVIMPINVTDGEGE